MGGFGKLERTCKVVKNGILEYENKKDGKFK